MQLGSFEGTPGFIPSFSTAHQQVTLLATEVGCFLEDEGGHAKQVAGKGAMWRTVLRVLSQKSIS